MKEYLFWDDEILIESINADIICLYVFKGKEVEKRMINNIAKEIILRINGMHTFDDIVKYFSQKYETSIEEVEGKLVPFLEELEEEYGLSIRTSSHTKEKKVKEKQQNLYPHVASLEITHKCNLKCLHCYGSFDCLNQKSMPIERIKKLLKDLNDIGTWVIELTGGECLIHSQFKEILLYALSLDFLHINILTNGVALTKEIKDIIICNRDRVFVQIDIHSLEDEYLEWFTGVKNIAEIIKSNVRELAGNNVKMRIATTVTKRNIDEVEKIADWVYSLGIKMYVPSSVIELGRAVYSEPDILLDQEMQIKLFKTIDRINEKYDGFINTLNSDEFRQSSNCGCLSSHVTIAATGDIKICTMDTGEYTGYQWGNVFEQNIKNIYDEKQSEFIIFSELEAPNALSEECRECEKRFFCSSCILRGIVAGKEKGEKCKWIKNMPFV